MMHLQMAIPSLDLRELRTSDADNLYQLIQFNRAHLTRLVDYTNYVELSVTELHAKLVATNSPEQTLDVNFENLLISAVSLIKYHTTESVRKLILLAKDEFCAKEIWTGITPTNSASINLVTRLSFKLLAGKKRAFVSYSDVATCHSLCICMSRAIEVHAT